MIAPLSPLFAPPGAAVRPALSVPADRTGDRPLVDEVVPTRGFAARAATAVAAAVSFASTLSLAAPTVSAAARPALVQAASACSEREVMADALLRRGYGARPVPPEVRRAVLQDLQAVPVEILRTLDASKVGLVVLQGGQTPHDLGLLRPVTVEGYLGDLTQLRAQVDRAREASRDPELERYIAAGSADADDSEFALLSLAELKAVRSEEFFARVVEETEGRVMPRTVLPSEDSYYQELRAGVEALTVEELAREHGAQTPQQVAEFTRLLKALNGPALERAQASYARSHGATDGEFQPWIEGIVVPGLFYRDGVRISGHDALSQATWEAGELGGQYFYEGGQNTVVLAPDALQREPGDRSILIHELGHALEDALSEQARPDFRRYRAERDEAYERLFETRGFPSGYSSASPQELAAESFAIAHAPERAVLRESDAEWHAEFQKLLDSATRLGTQRGPVCRAR